MSRAHASLVHAHGTRNCQKLSSRKASPDSMISRAMKSNTNEHTVRGRPTLKVVKRFRNGSVSKAYEGSNYERTFWVNLSRIMLIPKELSTGAINSSTPWKKDLQKRLRIFSRDREPSRIPALPHNVWATRAERLENLFLLFTNVSVKLGETSLSMIKLKSRTKRYSLVALCHAPP